MINVTGETLLSCPRPPTSGEETNAPNNLAHAGMHARYTKILEA